MEIENLRHVDMKKIVKNNHMDTEDALRVEGVKDSKREAKRRVNEIG